jgi:hypothetical protein
MPLFTGQQFGEFRNLLCDHFSVDELAQLVKISLTEKLGSIVGLGRPLVNIAYDLIEWLEHRDRTLEFLRAVRDERVTVPRVTSFCDPFLTPLDPGATRGTSGMPDRSALREKVVEFRTLFRDRKGKFKFLNAYKTLHDVLHKLQDQQVAILSAAQRFHVHPDDRLELKVIADQLEDELVAEAKAALPNAEFPTEAWLQWVSQFEDAVKKLRSSLETPDLPALDRAVQILGTLQNRQSALNEELIRCAKRLETNELLGKIEAILDGLRQLPATAAEDLHAGLNRFRKLCESLNALILDHDACQKIATSLAVPADRIVASEVFQWNEVLAALLQIAARRPEDKGAARMAEYARAFDSATEPKLAKTSFTLLSEQFGRLFYKTDERLLDITDHLVTEAEVLSTKLAGFAL